MSDESRSPEPVSEPASEPSALTRREPLFLASSLAPQEEPPPEVVFPGVRTWRQDASVETLAMDTMESLRQVWAAGSGGVQRWYVEAGKTSLRRWYSEHGPAGSDLTCLLATPDNRLIFGHRSGLLSVYAHRAWTVHNTKTGYPVVALALDGAHRVLACTAKGMFCLETGTLLETPEPPCAACFAFGTLWIGTANGLWRRDGERWLPAHGRRPITRLLATASRLYAAGIGGVIAVEPCADGTFETRHLLESPVHSLGFVDHKPVALANGGVCFTDTGRPLIPAGAHPVEAFTASREALIYRQGESLHYFRRSAEFAHENRDLLPLRTESPDQAEVLRVFALNDQAWPQTADGTLWQPGDTPEQPWRSIPCGVPAVGVMALGDDQIVIGLEGHRGLVTVKVKEGLPVPLEGPGYALAMGAPDGSEAGYVMCADGLYRLKSADVRPARIAPLPVDAGAVRGLIFDDDSSPLVLTSRGVYRLQGNALALVYEFPAPAREVAHDTDASDILFSDGLTLRRVSDGAPLALDPRCGPITALCVAFGRILIGTPDGLWIHGQSAPLRADNSGLAGSAILALWPVGAQVWALTGDGMSVLDWRGGDSVPDGKPPV